MLLRTSVRKTILLCLLNMAAPSWAMPAGSERQSPALPGWLREHIGPGEGQIALPVLSRARSLYARKVKEGAIRNPCYFAMDATRPGLRAHGELGRRFYVICESRQFYEAIPAGHGSGRNLPGVADFSNERVCARNFGNARDSELTTGGAYSTAETTSSFKGYYRTSTQKDAVLVRSFLQFDGEGATANARERAIGGHAAVVLKKVCLRKDPHSPYANQDGYVPFGNLVDYSGGRSNGCTSWSPDDAQKILKIAKGDPTTVYIYPEAADIDAVAKAVAAGRPLADQGLYWNSSCLKKIDVPRFWSREALEPVIAQFTRDHPAPASTGLPICRTE